MRILFAVLMAVVVVPGCGDPEKSRMAVGSHAMVLDHEKGSHAPMLREVEGLLYPHVDDGTRVMVINDGNQTEHDWGTRAVRIRVLDGPLKERSGTITRWDLRPE